jgi:hypothetical protein
MGEPDSELYRGARLTTALEWRSTSPPDLTSTEAAFLDRSAAVRDAERTAATLQQRNQARAHRRTRLLVTGVAALLVAVLVTGLLVVRQQGQREAADLAATIAEASRVDDARNTPDVDLALLLAVEAHNLHDSADTRAVLADQLSACPALIRSMALPSPVHGLAVSPDGGTVLVGSGDRGTASYGTGTLNQTAAYPLVPGWTMDYRPDGQQLLLAGRGYRGMGEDFDELSAALADPEITMMQRLHIDGLASTYQWAVDSQYSADGRFVVVGGIGLRRFRLQR